ncbi:MAG: hypothetical protein AB1560_04445 [Pseudomonadota bacterium]
MNTHRVAAMAMAMALAGFTHTLAAEEGDPAIPADDTLRENISEQEPAPEILTSEYGTPAQSVSQPADNLLSDLKVYPSF